MIDLGLDLGLKFVRVSRLEFGGLGWKHESERILVRRPNTLTTSNRRLVVLSCGRLLFTSAQVGVGPDSRRDVVVAGRRVWCCAVIELLLQLYVRNVRQGTKRIFVKNSLRSRSNRSQHPIPWTAASRRVRTRHLRRGREQHRRPGDRGAQQLRSTGRGQGLHRLPLQSTIHHHPLPPRARPLHLPIGI